MDPKHGPDLLDLSNKIKFNRSHDGHSDLISETELRQLSKGLHALFTAIDPSTLWDRIGHIGTVLCAILRTASAIGISSTHRAAACNALCGFLEHGLVSTTLELRSLIISNDVWQEAFTIYLNRSEDAKPKSMRQVLVTLTAILSKWPNPGQALVVRNRAVNTLLSIILGTDSRSKVKPALQALEHFTSKGVVPILDVVVSLQGLGNRNPGQLLSGSVLPQCAEAGTVAVVEFDDTHLSEPPLLASSEASIEFFVITLLEWVSHSDVAPAASRFISTFFKVLRKQDSKDVRYYHSVTKLPLWVSPLKRSVEQRLEGLEFLKHHVLPALFILDSHDMLQFVRSLPLEHLLSGTFPKVDWPEVLLLFSSLQVAQGLGLVRVIEQGIRENDSDDKSNIHVPLTACAQLLTHSSATIRVATLALLVTSTSTTKLFSPPVLSLIMENLTQFHADTDTGVRDHVIGITRCVVHRLRGAISQLNKALERQNNHASGHDSVKYLKQDCNAQQPDSVPSSQHSMEQHLAFLKWYIDFLGSELRPTASYQRHITALKALAILLQSGLDSTVPQAYLSKLAQEDFKWPLTIPIVQPLLIRMLFDLSMDPYDDVRCAAVLVLKMTASAMGIGLHRRIVSCLPSSAMVSVTHSSSSQRSSEGGSQNQEETSVLNLAAILSRAQKIMHSTGRADHADGVARLYEILDEICAARTTIARQGEILADVWWYSESSIVNRILSDLEKGLLLAKTNLRLAVADAPIHGDLSALRYIISRPQFHASLVERGDGTPNGWKVLHDRMLTCCDNVWASVRDMLCIDSPEGHTAEDLGDDLDIGDKDTLSFSWRALKEASSLLHAMLVNKTYSPQASGTGLQYEDLQRIGRLSFTQLAELRHRGAFSTVSQTFAACCVRCAQSPDKAIRDLLATWYKDTLLCIQDKGSKITRRSAGIPSLMSGILAAHPEKTAKKAFLDLQAIARSPVEAENGLQDISLPQVHALNSIKALYVNTKLGAYSEAYVSEGLDLAGACLESKIWAIRNCGLMLFRALIDRLFGTSEQLNQTEPNNHARALRLSYDKYPNLPRLLVRLLGGDILGDLSKQDDDTDVSSATPAEIVFPALEIIRRAGSPAQENVIISTLVMQHLGSKIWNVREMAARTYCSLVAEKEYLEKIALLLDLDWCTSNRLHGIMLSVKFLIGKHFRFEREYWREDLVCIISILEPYFDVIVVHTRCPFTQAAYLDIVNHVMWGILMTQDRRTVGTAFDTVDNLSLRASFCKKVEELRRDMQSKHELPNRSRIGHAESLLRQSAAWSLALYYVARSRFSHLKDLSQQLSDTDPDTACATLASLASPLLSQDCIYEGSALYYDIIHTSGYAEVRAVATKGYLHILDRTLSVQERRNSNKQSNASKSALSPFVERRVRRTTSGSGELDHDLRMRGYSLLAICGNNPVLPKEVEEKLEDWSRMLRLAGGERSDFSTRYAAVSSVKAFKAVLRPMGGVPNTSSALLDVYLALYDTLNDDDEEVRDLGADIVSWIVSTTPLHYPSQSLVPLAASLRFSKFLANTYSTSSNLFVQATKRLIGQTEDHYCLDIIRSEDNAVKAMKIQSVHDLLISARTEDTSLFVQEKQNLFIDEVREAEVWSRVLTLLSAAAYDDNTAADFSNWITEGLSTLTETAESEVDGPLGWTSKADVSALGMRVIFGASVLLHWEKAGIVHGCGARVLEELEALRGAGRKSLLHEMWIDLIEQVLAATT